MKMREIRAFSLVELLVVVAMMGLLLVLLAPALQSIGGGTQLTAAGDLLTSQLRLARQLAVSRNRGTQLWLISHRDENGGLQIRSLAVFIDGENADQAPTALGRPQNLPIPVVLEEDAVLSPLLQDLENLTGAELGVRLPGVGLDYSARMIRFRPDGRAEVPGDNSRNFLTLCPEHVTIASGQLPANYSMTQIVRQSGQVRTYRP